MAAALALGRELQSSLPRLQPIDKTGAPFRNVDDASTAPSSATRGSGKAPLPQLNGKAPLLEKENQNGAAPPANAFGAGKRPEGLQLSVDVPPRGTPLGAGPMDEPCSPTSPLSPISDVGPTSHVREPLSPMSPKSTYLAGPRDGGSTRRRTTDLGDMHLLEGGGIISSARHFQDTAAKKRWKKVQSLIRGAKSLRSTVCLGALKAENLRDNLSPGSKGHKYMLRRKGSKGSKDDDDESDSGFSSDEKGVPGESSRRAKLRKKKLGGSKDSDALTPQGSKDSIAPDLALSDLVQLLEREIHVSQAIEARLAKVFSTPGDTGANSARIPSSYAEDLCKSDLRKRQGLARLNDAMQELHRTLQPVAVAPELKSSSGERPRTVPSREGGHRRSVGESKLQPAVTPVKDMAEAQHLLDALRRICTGRVVEADPDYLAELICRTLQGLHHGAVDVEPRAEAVAAAAPTSPTWSNKGRRASI